MGTSKNRPFPRWRRQPRAHSLRRAQTWCSSHRAPSCIRPYTPVFRARLPCPHRKFLVFRGALISVFPKLVQLVSTTVTRNRRGFQEIHVCKEFRSAGCDSVKEQWSFTTALSRYVGMTFSEARGTRVCKSIYHLFWHSVV